MADGMETRKEGGRSFELLLVDMSSSRFSGSVRTFFNSSCTFSIPGSVGTGTASAGPGAVELVSDVSLMEPEWW